MALYIQEFEVECRDGSRLPIDMLRYDFCSPAKEEDIAIMAFVGQRVLIKRWVRSKNDMPSFSRWGRFGWVIIP